MSCVIGLVTDQTVILGADTAACDGNVVITNKFKKLFKWQIDFSGSDCELIKTIDIGIGVVGSVQTCNTIEFELDFPKPDREDRKHPERYIVTKLVPALRDVLTRSRERCGACAEHNGDEFMIGFMGKLFTLDTELGVVSPSSGYDAIGSGREVALGAMSSNGRPREYAGKILEPIERILDGLKVAEELTAFVRAPFDLVFIETQENEG
jgi:ATP-dependent protease HslVU (ClpYQ) peptidase subunit